MIKHLSLLSVASLTFLQGCASAPVWKNIDQAASVPTFEQTITYDHIEGDGRDDGKGYIPYLKALKAPPKRVALVSIYAVDPATTEKGGGMITTRWMSTAGAKSAANQMYKYGFPGMKAEFAAHGMQLLTPEEFLTDDAKKEFFKTFEAKRSKTSSIVGGALNFIRGNQGHDPVFQVADGFNEIYVNNGGIFHMGTSTPDDTFTNSVGSDLAKGLGVDAVLVVYSQFSVLEKATVITEANMYLFGPNPVPTKKDEEGFFGSRPGHHYGGVRVPLKFVYLGTDTETATDYAGFEKLFAAMSKKLATYIQEKTTQK